MITTSLSLLYGTAASLLFAACSGGNDTPQATNPTAEHGDAVVDNAADLMFTNSTSMTLAIPKFK